MAEQKIEVVQGLNWNFGAGGMADAMNKRIAKMAKEGWRLESVSSVHVNAWMKSRVVAFLTFGRV
ncbi:MAG: hypothetical protein R3C27_01520 [Hyphomonadaceae bacterium]